jgi:hypothetical protein
MAHSLRLAIDVDGVLANFTEAFVHEVNAIWPGRISRHFQPSQWDWSDAGMTQDENERVWERIKSKLNFWMELHPYLENVRAVAVHRVLYPEDEIFYVTARVSTAGMPVMHQTQLWLQSCGIGGVGTAVIVSEHSDKSDIYQAIGCDASIDDNLEAVIAHRASTKGAVLLDRPWNQSGRLAGIVVVKNLDQFFRRPKRETSKLS